MSASTPHIRRPDAEFPAEQRAEMRGAAEADAIGDLRQRARAGAAVEQHVVAALQSPVPDPMGYRRPFEGEERVQVAQGDAVAFGNRLERQVGFAEVVL